MMHEAVFLGFSGLAALGTTLLLGRALDLYLPSLLTTLALTICGALAGSGVASAVLVGELTTLSFGAIFGGGLMAVLTIPYFFRNDNRAAFDVVVTACLVGLLVARVGCYFNGCDLGAYTTWYWGVPSVHGGSSPALVHPFAWLIVIPSALFITFRWVRRTTVGYNAIHIAMAYLCIRFFAEFFRGSSAEPVILTLLNANQVLAIIALISAVVVSRFLPKLFPDHTTDTA